MRRLTHLLAAAALVVAAPSHIQAQTLNSGDRIRLNGVPDAKVATWDNVYVGPYEGMLQSDPTQPQLTLYCVDFANGVSQGDSWFVNVTGLTGTSSFQNTRLSAESPATSLVRYRKAAYLTTLFEANSGRSEMSGIHAAIWQIMTPGFPNLPGVNNPSLALSLAEPWMAMADQAAADGFVGMNWDEWKILSDVTASGPSGGKQEYLTRVTVTPEPETWALMFTGLLALGFFARRRIRELDSDLT